MAFSLGRRLGALIVLAAMAGPAAAAEPVLIFAAATLKAALDAAAAAAEASTHIHVTMVFGPSPALVKQLENGAPGDIFFSADPDWMNDAIARKVVDAATRVDLLSSELVLIAPASQARAMSIAPGFPLAMALGDSDRRLAMCDPMMMPAERYGRAALQKLGVWDSVKDYVVNAQDVRAAVAYVSRQEVPLGIVFDTDAKLDAGVAIVGTFPPDNHPPIVYPVAAVVRSRNVDATRILAFLLSAAATPIYQKYGYIELPHGS
jgi:molybdate transport system substrate-binding protein